MKRIIALVLAISLGGAALASDYKKIDPATTDAITATLTEQGYEVRRVKKDDGLYEAYAVKDGVKYEIYLNEKFEIVRTKIDD
ncbi:PepSY domain-containing protein [Roseovarius autotrophicus]|uniref:PepSY domain-containing protein n=1 Tax=Roseovarius autotrophicus TaxID=2824121 RepID=UPI001B38D976|nr:PepSY domain-containing protein [Roseovarius autotrophicus]